MSDGTPTPPAEVDPYEVPPRRRPSQGTHLVNGIRAAVDAWRGNGYPDASETTRRLLGFWFNDDHRGPDRAPFRFFFCQREAVETFIYLTEVRGVRGMSDLLPFAEHPVLVQPGEAARHRLAFKMATGSGKTKAMSLCIVWSYFHALREPDSPMATAFVVIAPNVIVFERLRTDFGDATTFRTDPLVPSEWEDNFEMTVLLQDDPAPVTTRGVLYLTNVQRLYEASTRGKQSASPNPVEAMVGPRVAAGDTGSSAEELFERIATHDRVMVVNDEAHHVWSEKLKWNQSIDRIHDQITGSAGDGAGVVAQLDFSATPKDQKGIIFRHTVVDYPLAEAVGAGIVKTPLIGELRGAEIELGDSAVQRFRQWIDVAVARWKIFHEALSPADKRPVLFVMCENTQAADEVGDYLHQLPEFAGDRLLVIHTNQAGEVTKKDLDLARTTAREIDGPDSPVRCIVSVLMLREGWDVRNVCLVLTLRSLTAKAKILPEQALGRGLRRMTPPGSGYQEKVVVIEHEAFRDLWSAELDGGLVVERADIDKVQPGAVTIFPDEGKRDFDLAIPTLTRTIAFAEVPLDRLTQDDLPDPKTQLEVPDIEPDEYIEYRGIHLINHVEVERHEFRVPYAEDPSGVVSWYTRNASRAAGVSGISGAFATLAPLVREFLERRVFDQEVELSDKVVLRRLAESDAQKTVTEAFREAILKLKISEDEAEIRESAFRVSETPPFPWSRKTVDAKKTVFNLTPVDNDLEGRFAKFLDKATDLGAFAKLTMNSGFALEYLASTGALRYYYPDFVIRLQDDSCLIVETKGLEDIEVARKDKRAQKWCRDASRLSGRDWSYLKVKQVDFDKFSGDSVKKLSQFLAAGAKQPS